MNSRSFVNVIKALAYLLAFFIIIAMITSLIFAINLFTGSNSQMEMQSIYKDDKIINNLDISLKATSLEIVDSKDFSVDTNNAKIKITYENGTLKICEKGTPSFNTSDLVLKISLPSTSNFKTVKVEMGAGKTHIANLNTDILDLNLGAGKNLLEKIEVNTQTKIESGAGLTEIMAGTLNNVDLDLGVGKVFINASILGNSKIECGVGATDLYLIDSLDDYKLELEKGIGSIEIGNKTYSSDTTIGNGKNFIKIDGGIGSINVNFKN